MPVPPGPYFYPRSPCGERPQVTFWQDIDDRISIHALLAESDPQTEQTPPPFWISIHALLAESDGKPHKLTGQKLVFLSTLSLRRATVCVIQLIERGLIFLSTLSLRRATYINSRTDNIKRFLSTLSLRRATNANLRRHGGNDDFYPRSPCGERQMHALIFANLMLFLSTLSLRRATLIEFRKLLYPGNFYPRSPCGERLMTLKSRPASQKFLSTLSLRRATIAFQHPAGFAGISIHALLAESDGCQRGPGVSDFDFYPRSPCGERRENRQPCGHPTRDFYPRSPCGERPV